jgi:hypothetical protein
MFRLRHTDTLLNNVWKIHLKLIKCCSYNLYYYYFTILLVLRLQNEGTSDLNGIYRVVTALVQYLRRLLGR